MKISRMNVSKNNLVIAIFLRSCRKTFKMYQKLRLHMQSFIFCFSEIKKVCYCFATLRLHLGIKQVTSIPGESKLVTEKTSSFYVAQNL